MALVFALVRSISRVRRFLVPTLMAGCALIGTGGHVLAHGEGHHHEEGALTALDTGLLVWGSLSLAAVFGALILSRVLLLRVVARPTRGGASDVPYLTAISRFSLNARLFLSYSVLAELGSGIWAVMFNLYLLRMGFPVTFIGTFWLLNMLCHGVAALPAGIIADRFGRRRAFFVATFISIAAQGTLLFTVEPMAILVLAAVAGLGEAFHGVTGAPFMMENSEPEERPHLFSLNASFLQFSRFGGSLAGGLLPLVIATVVGVPAVDPTAARWALVAGLPLTMIALVPLAFMKEKPVELLGSLWDLVTMRGVEHFGLMARFTGLSLMVGIAFGLTIRFFNVFFQEARQATDDEVGTILALAAIASAGAVLISPLLAQGWGKVTSIFITQAISVPFLLLMALVPSLEVVTTLFLVRGALSGIGAPLRNQLQMEFVSSKERGTTAGFTHMAFDLGGGVGAGMAGIIILDAGFVPVFSVAALLTLVPAYLYYVFFHRMEAEARPRADAALARSIATTA